MCHICSAVASAWIPMNEHGTRNVCVNCDRSIRTVFCTVQIELCYIIRQRNRTNLNTWQIRIFRMGESIREFQRFQPSAFLVHRSSCNENHFQCANAIFMIRFVLWVWLLNGFCRRHRRHHCPMRTWTSPCIFHTPSTPLVPFTNTHFGIESQCENAAFGIRKYVDATRVLVEFARIRLCTSACVALCLYDLAVGRLGRPGHIFAYGDEHYLWRRPLSRTMANDTQTHIHTYWFQLKLD